MNKVVVFVATLLVGVAFMFPQISFALPLECYCVMWLREMMDVPIRGDAWTLRPNVPRDSLTEGDVLLFNYGGRGKDHAALVLSFEGRQQIEDTYAPEFINVIEANYERCEVGTRKVRWDDVSIKGGLSTRSIIR